MLPISANAVIEKNKVTSDGTWLVLLEVITENEPEVRVCLNNEEVAWDGEQWYPAEFDLSGMVETKDSEVPSIPLNFFDVKRKLIPILEEYNGAIGSRVIVRIVHSKFLSNTTPEFEEHMEIIDTAIDSSARISFKLGAENLVNLRAPLQRFLKNNCRYIFKASEILFTDGGSNVIPVPCYIKGDASGSTAKVTCIKLISGSFLAGTAAGRIQIHTTAGTFQTETFSAYSDSSLTVLIQSNIGNCNGPSKGRCGYTGFETKCNRSYARCTELNNKRRFGGFLGVGATGVQG